ncbi:ADP-ribosylhydrolase ARH3-like isoform X2 [Schistocerca cancellata]|uniref:ADP-ribosylhydrolase ARH3-like isoform X2 n=1 Tax=Schistocerca cancellata TaxID=274614 RepID=UPI002117F16A|nr:ADP-ribosylhydrolase ARH3-like isoform X2 [Schistocerca cancellata]
MQRILPVMTKMDLSTLSQKFRGCMLGSLLGDCLGAPYEGDSSVSKAVLQQYFDKIEGPPFKAPIKQYTDDTAMTKCVAESLIDCRGFEPQDMAKKFVKEFFASPRRGYGQNVVRVFMKLKDQKCEDPFGPAKEQFDGAGSLGNGGAMRVAPVALFYHQDYPALIEKARKSALLTHTNKLGRDGAILQAIAVYQGLQSIPSEGLDATTFIKELMNKMHEIEDDDYGLRTPSAARSSMPYLWVVTQTLLPAWREPLQGHTMANLQFRNPSRGTVKVTLRSWISQTVSWLPVINHEMLLCHY